MTLTLASATKVLKSLYSKAAISGEVCHSWEAAQTILINAVLPSAFFQIIGVEKKGEKPVRLYEEINRLEGQIKSAFILHEKRNGSIIDCPFPVKAWLEARGIKRSLVGFY